MRGVGGSPIFLLIGILIFLLITQWEESEQDEWMVEEGLRRGGRKLSRRMSELLGIFGEGEKASMVGLESGRTVLEDKELSSLPSISLSLSSKTDNMSLSSKKSENAASIKSYRVENKMLFRGEKTLSAGCDWPVVVTS